MLVVRNLEIDYIACKIFELLNIIQGVPDNLTHFVLDLFLKVMLTLSPMGGPLRPPPLAELAIAPKRIYVLI